jgi:long-chain fatty acid transport protein
MTRRPIRAAAIAATMIAVTRAAHADSGALFGESSRTAALGDAVTARPGETSAIYYNPGALADVDRPTLAFTSHIGTLGTWYERSGEARQEQRRTIAGFGLALASPLPIGPEWARPFTVGAAVHVPAQHALRLTAPSRPDEPSFPLYGDRAERTAATASVAVRLFSRLGVGFGVTLTPTLVAPTRVSYDPARGETADDHVVVDLDRELRVEASALAGLRTKVSDALSLGLAYRQAIETRAEGPNDTAAGGLVVRDQINFVDFLAPEELAAGVAVFPSSRLSVSGDVVRARWSRYRTIHAAEPAPRFSDVTNLRLGAEWSGAPGIAVRGGYAFEPSPVPEQVLTTNLFDADRHVLSIGGGFDLRTRGWAPLRIDAHLRTHLVGTHHADKRAAALPDDDATTPGQQIGNLGFPSVSGSASFWQVGLTILCFLSKGPTP